MMKNRKLKMTAGLVCLLLVAGVLAYFSSTMSIDNPFNTKKYGGETIEKFTPEKDWEPGEEITKEVLAKNTGDYDIFVRVMMSEKWERDGKPINGTNLSSKDKDKFFPKDDLKAIANGSSVYKKLASPLTDWVQNDDGYFYYNKALKKDESTTKLLEAVTLCKDANMGTYEAQPAKYAVVDKGTEEENIKKEDYKYTADELKDMDLTNKDVYQKVVTELKSGEEGLAGATYTLTIKTEIIQANADAATEMGWATYPRK